MQHSVFIGLSERKPKQIEKQMIITIAGPILWFIPLKHRKIKYKIINVASTLTIVLFFGLKTQCSLSHTYK